VISERDHVQVSAAESKLTESEAAKHKRLFPNSEAEAGQENGVRLGQFDVRKRIGSGGMGVVFQATDTELSRDVALKVLHPGTTNDPALIARFRNEARACAQLNHDNIARVHLSGKVDGLYFIAYELADGITIRDLIAKHGQLSPEETVNYAIQVTLALNHLNAEGVVHRDIKPSNIMLTDRGRVKVVDLGLARREVSDSIGDLTVAGTTLGTFDYIAPEQARDPRIADIRSDIYSLGCTMYQMLTGQPPYPEGTALQKLLDHQGKSPPDPRSINNTIPTQLAAVIRKMMSSDPMQRYQVPALLLSDLLQIAASMGLRSVPADGIVWKKSDGIGPRSPIGAAWLFGSVLVICLTALTLSWMGNEPVRSDYVAELDDNPGSPMSPEQFMKVEDAADPSSDTTTTATGDETVTSDAGSSTGENTGADSTPRSDGSPVASLDGSGDSGNTGSLTASSIPIPVPLPTLNFQWPGAASVTPPPTETTSVSPTPVPQSDGRFVLQTPEGSTRSFYTLQAAVADSRSGDAILLQYNGNPADIPAQPPVRISGMNLIIRAADGFRPTLEFMAEPDPGGMTSTLFTVRNSSSLTVRDIDIRFVMNPDLSADSVAVFRSDSANRLQLSGVGIDVVNDSEQAVSMFELTDMANGTELNLPVPENEAVLTNCILRGAADVFRLKTQKRTSIRLLNSCCAVEGVVFQNVGNASMLQTPGVIDVQMEHVTAIFGRELIHMKDSDELTGNGAQRVLPSMIVRSEACVFSGCREETRLVLSEGNGYLEDLEQLLTWTGFTNLYHGFDVFWQIDTAAFDYSSRRLDFSEWQQGWMAQLESEENNAATIGDTVWLDPSLRTSGTLNNLLVTDLSLFELDATQFGSASGALSLSRDGKVPGVDTSRLRGPITPMVQFGSALPAATPISTSPLGGRRTSVR